MASFRYSPVSVTEQPLPSGKLSLDMQSTPLSLSEKYSDECQQQADHSCSCEESHHHSTAPSPNRRRCHNGRLRLLFVPALIALLLLGGALVYFCMNHGLSALGMDGLLARAVSDTTTGNESTFTKHKCKSRSLFFVSLFAVFLPCKPKSVPDRYFRRSFGCGYSRCYA